MKTFPKGWVYSSIGSLCTLHNGRAFKPSEWKDSGLPIVRIQNLNRASATFNHFDGAFDPRHQLKGGELLFAWSGTPGTSFGAHIWQGGAALLNQHIFRVDFNEVFLDKRFFRYAINQTLGELVDIAHGGVGLRHVTKGKFEDTNVALPPRREQQRIADKLDAALARANICLGRLDRIPAILKRFRQSVLAAAISGKLTEEWRAELEVSISEWESTTFEAESKEITVGYVGKMSSEYRNSGVPFLRSLNVRPFRFDARELRFISPEFHQRIRKSALKPGDVVVVRTGAPGQCCVIPIDLPQANCSDLVVVRPGPKLLAAFACLYINSELSQAFVRSEQVGVAQLHFNVGSMKRAPLALPSIEEQTEIVRRVDALFAYADRLEACYITARAKVERLTPCLLAKAFRGELVPQDPNDEPAADLLGRIAGKPALALRSKHAPKTRQSEQGSAVKINILAKEANSMKKQSLSTLEDIAPNHLANILLATKRGEAKALWTASGLSIDVFYIQLRREISAGLLCVSADDESQLESVTSDDSTV